MLRVVPVPAVAWGHRRLGASGTLAHIMPAEGETQTKRVMAQNKVTLFRAAGTQVPSLWPWGRRLSSWRGQGQ